MINTENMSEPQVEETSQDTANEPDENGGLLVQGYFRIVDPESGKVIVQGRA